MLLVPDYIARLFVGVSVERAKLYAQNYSTALLLIPNHEPRVHASEVHSIDPMSYITKMAQHFSYTTSQFEIGP